MQVMTMSTVAPTPAMVPARGLRNFTRTKQAAVMRMMPPRLRRICSVLGVTMPSYTRSEDMVPYSLLKSWPVNTAQQEAANMNDAIIFLAFGAARR